MTGNMHQYLKNEKQGLVSKPVYLSPCPLPSFPLKDYFRIDDTRSILSVVLQFSSIFALDALKMCIAASTESFVGCYKRY